MSAIDDYILELHEQFASEQAREHGYRPALERLLRSFDDVGATNDPKRSEHGNPDMIFYKKSNHHIVLGYAEAKDITVDLDKIVKSEQLRRYAGYNKLFLTNYLDFRFYRNGEEYERINLGSLSGRVVKIDSSQTARLMHELQAFLELPPEPIRNGKNLALIMGAKGQRIRDNVARYLEAANDKNEELEKIYTMMRELLVHDLTKEKFADMYAQTLVYGLFAARYADSTPDDFSRAEARDLVPKSNPFLRKFFDHIAGSDFDIRLAHIVDELCQVFAVSNVHLLVQKHLRLFEVENDKDPIIHFYEDFLKEYDPLERKRMGAYYTPVPVVRFMVRQVDEILKRDFGLPKGLADTSKIVKEIDHGQQLHIRSAKTGRLEKTTVERREFHKVQLLDPAVGTATFLNETIKYIYDYQKSRGQQGHWAAYVEEDLLPRLSGFELMMAPYTIAHLKLGMTLQETGVDTITQRLGVYLTNTLEEGIPRQQDLFSIGLAAAVTEESQKASEIKHERPIMIVMGNPPYSGESSNKTKYAGQLIDKYKVEPGGLQKLQEVNSKWINDDYVKFIAFAEDMIACSGEGVVAMITNNGYLNNPTFRGMRWHLAQTFSHLYILNLHGNAKKHETKPDGGADDNVFDIMQGVAIIIGIKTDTATTLADVSYAEIYGSRKEKFAFLGSDIAWQRLELDPKMLYFANKNLTGQTDYDAGVALQDLFIQKSTGMLTKNDRVAIAFDKATIWDTVTDFTNLDPASLRNKYALKRDSRDWALERAVNDVTSNYSPDNIVAVNYRPFDSRFTYYTGQSKGFMAYSQMKTLQHMLQDNTALIIERQTFGHEFAHAFISNDLSELHYLSILGGSVVNPLYLYHDDGTRSANFAPKVLKQLTKNLSQTYPPEDILDYIYAVLYSPSYRKKYQEFLKLDFPRIPVPENDVEFMRLAAFGKQLRELHLLKSATVDNYDTTFPQRGTNEVEKLQFADDQVWINDSQYFDKVPAVAWEFYIGGYQPAQKWLKDRRGRKLSSSDVEHYQKIIRVLTETDTIMKQIDGDDDADRTA